MYIKGFSWITCWGQEHREQRWRHFYWFPKKIGKNLYLFSLFSALSEYFGRSFQYTSAQVIFKEANTLKTTLMCPKDKTPSQLKQTLSTNGPAQKKIATFPKQESPADVWNKKKHNSHIISTICQKCFQHPSQSQHCPLQNNRPWYQTNCQRSHSYQNQQPCP